MLTKNHAIEMVAFKAGPDDGLNEGQFTAYASVFGNRDSYGDVVVPGAFSKDLARWEKSGNPIPLLFGHNMSNPDYNIGHIIKAEEDTVGLKVTCELDLENPKARQVYRMLKGRRINQMSFACHPGRRNGLGTAGTQDLRGIGGDDRREQRDGNPRREVDPQRCAACAARHQSWPRAVGQERGRTPRGA
jgi:HK97 family phage prohead protease